ncbi:MAG TPA: M12 family metallo-peptidase, partial [Chitinophagaceae bacterium]|nr:M12 family metallo-peptidase [Chitinophagaceae bacterium]
MIYRKITFLILLNVIALLTHAQNKLNFKENNSIQVNLSQHFEHYKILDVKDSLNELFKGATVQIDYLNNYTYTLRENKLMSSNFLMKINTPNGIEQKSIYDTDFDGKYFMNSNYSLHNQFIFSSYQEMYTIYIKDSVHDFYIEPLLNYIPNSDKQLYVYYNKADVKQKNVSCADTAINNISVPQAQVLSGGCFQTELAIACDYSMYQYHGSINNVLNRVLTITNLVNGDYTIINGLTDDVNFKVVEFYLPICDSCNPWQYTNNLYSILFNFQGGGLFTNNYDLAQYWNVGYSGPIGIALLSGVCGGQRFNVCADYSGLNDLRSLSSHEIGHNFGCQHDVSVLNIMYPQNYGMSNWTSQSVSEIGNTLNTVTCLSACPALQQCDTQSVYNLTITTDTIQHWAKATWDAVSGVSYKVRWYNYTTTTWTAYSTLAYPIDSAMLSIPASVNCSNKYRFEIIPICGTTVGNSYQVKFIYNKIHDINNLMAIKNGNGIKLSWSPSIYVKHVEIVNNVLATSQFYTVPIGIDTFHFAFPTTCADTSFTCKVGNQCDATHIGNLSSLTVLRTFPNLQTTNPFCPPMSVVTNLPNTSNIGYTINWVNNTNSTT